MAMPPRSICNTWRLPAILLLCIFTYNTGCYHFRVMAPNPDPVTEYKSETMHSLFWGLIQSKPLRPANCESSNGIDELHVSTNFGYALITVATLGIWCPMKVEWRCSKPCPPAAGDL